MQVREYGTSGHSVVLLHGGPGAPGYMAPVARPLADSFRVLEPRQRGSGAEPLTVARHVADLHELLEQRCGDRRPALVGHSWGAMLALAYAAEHPDPALPLVLIGSGTFDLEARERMKAIREERMDDVSRRRAEELQEEIANPDERLAAMGNLMLPLDSYELIASETEFQKCDARANRETWDDMIRLQEAGVYPQAFQAIAAPVIMLHGCMDPHPGSMIRASLEPHLPQLEYREWQRCGHYPWLEKAAHEQFFVVLRKWLERQLARDT